MEAEHPCRGLIGLSRRGNSHFFYSPSWSREMTIFSSKWYPSCSSWINLEFHCLVKSPVSYALPRILLLLIDFPLVLQLNLLFLSFFNFTARISISADKVPLAHFHASTCSWTKTIRRTAKTRLKQKIISPRCFKVQAQSMFADPRAWAKINFRYPYTEKEHETVQILIRNSLFRCWLIKFSSLFECGCAKL